MKKYSDDQSMTNSGVMRVQPHHKIDMVKLTVYLENHNDWVTGPVTMYEFKGRGSQTLLIN